MAQGILQTPCWLQYPSWGLEGCQAVWEACREQPLYSQSNLNLFPSPRSGFRLPPNPQSGQSPVPFHLFHCLFFLLPSQTWNKQILTLQTYLVFYTPKDVSQKWHCLIGHGEMTSISHARRLFECWQFGSLWRRDPRKRVLFSRSS